MFNKICSNCERCLAYKGHYCEGKIKKCSQYTSEEETKNFWLHVAGKKAREF